MQYYVHFYVRVSVFFQSEDPKRPKWCCSRCNAVFTDEGKFLRHNKMNCLGLQSRQLCNDCGRFYASKDSLRKHQKLYCKKVYNVDLNLHKCGNCSKCFKTKGNFIKHKSTCNKSKIVHKIFKCSKCKKSFSNRGRLYHHLQQHGAGEIPDTHKNFN